MNSSNALRKVALPLLVAFAVLYLFGMRSGFATGALLLISVSVLYFMLSSVLLGARAAQDARDASEKTFRHGGRDFRIFVHEQGEIWLRASDIKRFLAHIQSDAVLARRYPSRVGLAHPQIVANYMHHDAPRDFLGKNGLERVQRFLTWLNRDVRGIYRFERVMTPVTTPRACNLRSSIQPRHNLLLTWFRHHGRGEVGLMFAVFGGAMVVGRASLAVHCSKNRWTLRCTTVCRR